MNTKQLRVFRHFLTLDASLSFLLISVHVVEDNGSVKRLKIGRQPPCSWKKISGCPTVTM